MVLNGSDHSEVQCTSLVDLRSADMCEYDANNPGVMLVAVTTGKGKINHLFDGETTIL